MRPLVSVVIATRNEASNIEKCLLSIKSQSYPSDEIEIIVIDNNSSDDTIRIAKKYAKNVYNKGPERSAQRNFGGKKANGKYILFLDADMILSKEVIEECVLKCENEKYSALYIPERIVGKGFWIKVRDFERTFYNTTCIDAVRFIETLKFLEIGGFDLSLTGPEDWDFDRRIREISNVATINTPLYHNEGKFNLKKYLEKKDYYSRDIDIYIRKWGKQDPIVKKQLGMRYRLFDVFIEKGKWKRLITHLGLTFCMYLLRFLVGIHYLKKRSKSYPSLELNPFV